MSKDFSIIIPHRGPSLGLWATICGCEVQLKNSDYSYNYCIYSNGNEKESHDLLNTIKYLEKVKKLEYYSHTVDSVTASKAREVCVNNSTGSLLLFFDNHCIPDANYFNYIEKVFLDNTVDILHSSTIFYPGEDLTSYHYHLTLDYNFWGYSSNIPENSYKTYKCAAAGHGGFAVRRNAWYEVGGYGPDYLLNGYAGEELLFDLKAWRLGKKVHLHPKILHYHSAANREYSRHFTDEFYINLMTSALVIGGVDWLDRVYESFSSKSHIRTSSFGSRGLSMFDLYTIAYDRGIKYSKELDKIAKYTLNQLLLDVFPKEGVAI